LPHGKMPTLPVVMCSHRRDSARGVAWQTGTKAWRLRHTAHGTLRPHCRRTKHVGAVVEPSRTSGAVKCTVVGTQVASDRWGTPSMCAKPTSIIVAC
jgi:hypothetical protein